MAEEEAAPEGEEGEGGKKGGKGKLIIILVVVLVLLGGAGAAALVFLGGGDDASEDDDEADAEPVYQTVELDTFIVNLSDNSSFLKIRMLIEYDPAILFAGGEGGGGGGHGGGGHGSAGGGGGEPEPGLPGRMGEREPMLRDAIIRVLSSKTAEDVLSVDGKEILKEELIEAINEALNLDEAPVVNIYFTEFIVQ